jgi:hypothetical protein
MVLRIIPAGNSPANCTKQKDLTARVRGLFVARCNTMPGN